MATLTSSETVVGTESQASLVSSAITVSNGDVLVVKATSEGTQLVPGTASGGSQAWTKNVSQGSKTPNAIYTATVSGSPGTVTVTLTFTGSASQYHSMVVERWTSAQLAATPATCNAAGSGAPSTTITTAANSSQVSWTCGDWNAVAPGTPAYRSSATTDTGSPVNQSGRYTVYNATQAAATAGSQTLGLTAPTGQDWTILGIEVQTSGGSSHTQTPTDSAGATDAVAIARSIVVVDSGGSVDSAQVGSAQAYSQSPTDNAVTTDSPTVARGIVSTTSDNAVTTDSGTLIVDYATPADEAAGSTDSATFAWARGTATTDDAGSTDTAGLSGSRSLTQADLAGITDTAAVDLQVAGAIARTDEAGSTDTAGLTRSHAYSDTAGVSDAGTTTLAFAIGTTDDGGATDSSSATRILVATDTAGSADASAIDTAGGGGVTATDNAGTSDSVASVGIYQRAVTDTAGTVDTGIISANGSQSTTDAAGSSDVALVELGRVVTVTDLAGISDAASLTLLRTVMAVDDATVSDATAWARALASVDMVGVSDLAARSGTNFGQAVRRPGLVLTTPRSGLEVDG